MPKEKRSKKSWVTTNPAISFTGAYDHYFGTTFFKDGEGIFVNKIEEDPRSIMHSHNFLEIAYVVSGTGTHYIGNQEFPVARGDLFVINHDIPHVFRSNSSTESMLTVYNCGFNPEFLDYDLVNCHDFTDITQHFLFHSFFPEEGISGSDIHLIGSDNRIFERLFEKMLEEYTKRENGYMEMLRALVIELLISVFRAFRSSKHQIDNRQNQIVEKIILYIKDNFASELRIEDLSSMAFLSSNHFCKLFKEYTHMTVIEYAQSLRIEEACRLLRETDMKVVAIASQVGYRDLKFFNQVFKRQMGDPPTTYRKKHSILETS